MDLPYLPFNGDVLDIDELNKDLYEVQANLPAGKVSLYETSNGQIDIPTNFNPAFKVQQHHVRPWQVADAKTAGLIDPVDYYEDAWGKPSDDQGYDPVFYGIAGANISFYVPYDTSLALLATSAFFSTWRARGAEIEGQDPPEYKKPPIKVRAYFDGQPIRHTERNLPKTVFFSEGLGGFDFTREARLTRQFNLHHMKYTGGDIAKGHHRLLKGWHSFGLGVFIEANDGAETFFPAGLSGSPDVECVPLSFDALQRVRVYVRSVTTLPLL